MPGCSGHLRFLAAFGWCRNDIEVTPTVGNSIFEAMTKRRLIDYWLLGILDIKYDKPIVENKLTLLCKQRRIIPWTIGASQPRFYPAA